MATVARFIKDAIVASQAYRLKIVSLSTAARDECNLSMSRPATWMRGAVAAAGVWEGLPFEHVGAVFGELEFQRFRHRKALTERVAECDLLQVVCGSSAWANAVCGLGKPVALQCATLVKSERRRRDAMASGLKGGWRRAMSRITEAMDDLALQRVDAIQVENRWMLEYARKLNEGRSVDVRYAPPGIDARAFTPSKARLLQPVPYILCVGRLDDPRKNVELLLESYLRIPGEVRSRVRLVLAGSSGPPPRFWAQAQREGVAERITVVHHPDHSKLVTLYQNALAFALPSHEEGLGLVALEAMACGVPVVSTRCGGPEEIISDSVDGFLVPLNDADGFADRLLRLCMDEALNVDMGASARLTVEKRYSHEVTAGSFLDVWHRLLH